MLRIRITKDCVAGIGALKADDEIEAGREMNERNARALITADVAEEIVAGPVKPPKKVKPK